MTDRAASISFPDARSRSQTCMAIGHGTDVETMRRIILDTVQQVGHQPVPDECWYQVPQCLVLRDTLG
jgi:hypothetical protein